MPLYEYVCSECECKWDLLRSMSQADAPTECPQCQSTSARRAPSRFASFSKSANGERHAVSGAGDGCGNCSGGSCGHCSHH